MTLTLKIALLILGSLTGSVVGYFIIACITKIGSSRNQKNIRKIVQEYKPVSQEDVAIEEMSELTKALLKRRRKGITLETYTDIIDEIADVQIMLNQLMLIYDCSEEVHKRIRYKLDRQIKRLESEKSG